MPRYVYQSIPKEPGEAPRHFEFMQKMSDEPLATHPETGEAIRRVIVGGYGLLSSSRSVLSEGGGGGCCGGSGCCN